MAIRKSPAQHSTAIIGVPEEIPGQLAEETARYAALVQTVKAVPVDDASSVKWAGEVLISLKAKLTALDARRTYTNRPLLEAKRRVDALFAAPLGALRDLEAHLKGAIACYNQSVEQTRVAAMREAAAALEAGRTPTEIIPAPVEVQCVTVRHFWRAEVIDADAVPRELCSPDPEKIQAAIWYADTPHTAPRPIPGLVFHLDNSVIARQPR